MTHFILESVIYILPDIKVNTVLLPGIPDSLLPDRLFTIFSIGIFKKV
jgi:hypothetical protein